MIEPLEPKTPTDVKQFGIDWRVYFAERAPDTRILASSWAIQGDLGSPDLEIETDGIAVDEQQTMVLLSGGEVDRDYTLVNTVITDAPETLAQMIKVRLRSVEESASL